MRAVLAAATAAGSTLVVRRVLGDRVEGSPRWTRTNHRGAPVSLLAGPAVGAGVVAGCLVAGAAAGPGQGRRTAWAGALAAAGGLAFGLVDDLTEDTGAARKGLRGHLGALLHGELTTGGLKVLGIGAAGLAAAAVHHGRPRAAAGWLTDVVVGGALVAASANLVNLLDLRPGRAVKAVVLGAAPTVTGAGGPVAAAALAAGAAALPADLDERDMLGDAGANALGAAVGVAALAGTGRVVRAVLLAAVVAVTVLSERVSLSVVIARTPGLRELDAWGRRG